MAVLQARGFPTFQDTSLAPMVMCGTPVVSQDPYLDNALTTPHQTTDDAQEYDCEPLSGDADSDLVLVDPSSIHVPVV